MSALAESHHPDAKPGGLARTIVLVGLMGAGKSCIGRRLAQRLGLAFIDADKAGYRTYFEALVPRMRPGGCILVDNVLWSGRVIDDAATDDDTRAIRDFNDAVAADPRVEVVMLPVADGLTVARVRP